MNGKTLRLLRREQERSLSVGQPVSFRTLKNEWKQLTSNQRASKRLYLNSLVYGFCKPTWEQKLKALSVLKSATSNSVNKK